MTFERIVEDIQRTNLNLYDFAFYTKDGIQVHRFQPCNNCNNSYSVAKAFIMTAVGLLWDDGLLNVTDPLYPLFADKFPPNADPGWKLATVEHALTHKLGFDKGFLDIDTEDVTAYPTDDYLSIVLSHPLAHLPGTHYQYSDAAFYLLSCLVSQVAGEHVDSLLSRRVFQPMRFHEVAWSRCPHGYPIGATGLYLSAEDLVKLGALYLNEGMYEGKRLLSAEWVHEAITHEYEFTMVTRNGLIGKGGMYGQALFFSREKHFAVACHAHEMDRAGQRLIEYLDGIN